MLNHMSTSYLYVHTQLHLDMHDIINVHVLAIPVYDQHTVNLILDATKKSLDNMYPAWKDTIIGITEDGKRNMTGRISDVATLFQQAEKPRFLLIWCLYHHIDLVL